MMKTAMITIGVLFVLVSVCGCIAGTHSDEKYDSEPDQTTSSNSEVTDTSPSNTVDDNEDSDPLMDNTEKVCPHCGGDPNHICQQCPDGCYLCGGTGYVYE